MTTTTHTIKALLIKPGADVAHVIRVAHNLDDFKRLVGGWIEGLSLGSGIYAYINEEGKQLGLPVNDYGDVLVRHLLMQVGRRLNPGDVIVGPLVLVGPPNDEGEDTDVPNEAVTLVMQMGMTVEEVAA